MSIRLEKVENVPLPLVLLTPASSQGMLLSLSLLKQHSKNILKLVRHVSQNLFDVLKEHKEAHEIARKKRYYNEFPKKALQLSKFF